MQTHLTFAMNKEQKPEIIKPDGAIYTIYKYDKLVISKKHNNLQLLKQRLMTLSPQKYNKFLRMMNLYGDFEELKEWKENMEEPYNKIPDWLINEILLLHFENPSAPAWKIAEQLEGLVSTIKISRVRKEHCLT